MFSNASGILIQGGTLINNNDGSANRARGMDILMERVATGAFHNSGELYDAPKCHPRTRVAVLEDIMQWVDESESAQEYFMMWLFGPAGAGKSAIAKRIAEIAAERGLLIADFFFSRTSATRNTKDGLIATIAYQMAVSIPETRFYIEDGIERDPAIFNKNIPTQIDALLIKPLRSISPTQICHNKKLIIIDGLDECNDSKAQVAILDAISRSLTQHKLPIKFLIVSRPELDLNTAFNCNEPLKFIHRRLALDDTYRPDDDIRLFFSEKFEHIKRTHRLRSTIPVSWPTRETLETLVEKSSGQFIYASTVVKFVESSRHPPSARLNIILGISPPGRTNPFAELDALYNHILSSVDDIQLTLRVLSLYVMTPVFAQFFSAHCHGSMPPELFLSLEPGDIQLALIDLSSIITVDLYGESCTVVKVLHASLFDFLSDKCRSTTFYIDKANTSTDFVRRILEFVKGPDGIRAGDIYLFRRVIDLSFWISKGQLRSEILNFDIDEFIDASIRYRDKIHLFPSKGSTILAFDIWMKFLHDAGLDDGDKKDALDRLNKSLESRLQIYQSDWRLQLLLPLSLSYIPHYLGTYNQTPFCRCMDILLDMDNHDLHLADQRALDLRHDLGMTWSDMKPPRADCDANALAALHCMRFLSNPPNYSKRIQSPEKGLSYVEWEATCNTALVILSELLGQANTFPELVQFISNQDIHPKIQERFRDRVWGVNVCILELLSRANVYPQWRIISTIRQTLSMTRGYWWSYNYNARYVEDEE